LVLTGEELEAVVASMAELPGAVPAVDEAGVALEVASAETALLGLADGLALAVALEEPSVSVTGQTVVEIAMMEVTTLVDSAGQLVTVGAQLVTVISWVE